MKPGIREVETDILVIGGGMAGCMATIKTGEKGLSVTLVEKGAVSRSGCTPWALSLLAHPTYRCPDPLSHTVQTLNFNFSWLFFP